MRDPTCCGRRIWRPRRPVSNLLSFLPPLPACLIASGFSIELYPVINAAAFTLQNSRTLVLKNSFVPSVTVQSQQPFTFVIVYQVSCFLLHFHLLANMNVSRLINSTFVLGGRTHSAKSISPPSCSSATWRMAHVGHVVLNTWQFSVLVWHSLRHPSVAISRTTSVMREQRNEWTARARGARRRPRS